MMRLLKTAVIFNLSFKRNVSNPECGFLYKGDLERTRAITGVTGEAEPRHTTGQHQGTSSSHLAEKLVT